MTNFIPQDKSLLVFGLSTVSVYLLIKGLNRVLERAGTRKEGILKLIIYPIKSVPGIEVDHLEVTPTGVTYGGFHDRALMLINEHRNLVSLRTKPTLACIKASFEGDDSIVLRAPSMPPLVISNSRDVSANEQFTFSFWNQETTGFEYSQEASAWFSLYLKSTTKLVKSHYQPSSSSDITSLRKTELHTEADELVLDADHRLVYQDECAVALANESSLTELNRRLTAKGRPPVGYRNFRPNIFLRTGQQVPPFGEDAWRRIQLGSRVVLKLAKPCHRCTTTTTDPESGRKNDNFEPLETLKEFRVREEYSHLYSSSPLFGLSLSPVVLGTLRLGDSLTVLEEKQKQ